MLGKLSSFGPCGAERIEVPGINAIFKLRGKPIRKNSRGT